MKLRMQFKIASATGLMALALAGCGGSPLMMGGRSLLPGLKGKTADETLSRGGQLTSALR